MHKFRTSRTRLLGAAATVALAALSLTACSEGAGGHNESSSPNTETVAKTTDRTADRTTGQDSGRNSNRNSNRNSGRTTGKGTDKTASDAQAAGSGREDSTGSPVTCTAANTKTVAAPLTRPINHMLLTVTNTGDRPCYLYSYPAVRFGEAQSVPPVIEDSHPQAVVTLDPGQSGYSAVALSAGDGSGTHGHTVQTLDVYFHGRSGNESVGDPASPALPAEGVYVDDSLQVTYWQQEMDDAIVW